MVEETKVRERWLGERGGPVPRGSGNVNRLGKHFDVPGTLLPSPAEKGSNKISLLELASRAEWRALMPQHKQMLASFLYADVSMAEVIMAFGITADRNQAKKIADEVLAVPSVVAVIKLVK